MREVRDRTGKSVAIGYQWSFSEAIQKLKHDVMQLSLGKAKRLKTLVLWPRDEAYFARNRWAGAIKDAKGNPVLDSPVNNACAHYLHNMLYVLGHCVDRSAQPRRVTAELYRAQPIQNYDTAAIRVITLDGTELLFIVSHSTAIQRGPILYALEGIDNGGPLKDVKIPLDTPLTSTFRAGLLGQSHDAGVCAVLRRRSGAQFKRIACVDNTATDRLAGTALHFTVLSRLGINGWTGEPRDRFEALLREIEAKGERRTLFNVVRPRRRSSP